MIIFYIVFRRLMSDKTFIVEVEARKAMKTLIVGLELEAV